MVRSIVLASWFVVVASVVACGGGAVGSSDQVDEALSDGAPGDGRDEVVPEIPLGEIPSEVVENLDEATDTFDVPPDEVGETTSCEPPYAGWQCPCSEGDDCASGYCVEGPGGRVCSLPCVNSCDLPGWECRILPDTCPDCQSICMYALLRLCQPCTAHADCAVGENAPDTRCLSYGASGSFCGSPCDAATDCPEGYECATETPQGGPKQCWLSEGTCTCNPWAIETAVSTTCQVSNAAGACSGTRYCAEDGLTECDAATPKAETCNGKDDDCDTAIDEDLPVEACEVTNAFGACPGVLECQAGVPRCVGPSAVAETCNGKDDDCDTQTDEDFPDLDDDGLANCVDLDDDGDGVLDDGNYSGSVGDNPCDPGETVDCDDNCPSDANPDQADLDNDAKGNACDKDADGDGYVSRVYSDGTDCNDLDPAVHPGVPETQNSAQACQYCNGKDDDCDGKSDEGCYDTDLDGTPDCVDGDDDGDGVPDDGNGSGVVGDLRCLSGQTTGCDDNCPLAANADQYDGDNDGQGDACDADDDNDGVPDDGDGSAVIGDHLCTKGANQSCDDNCRTVANPLQIDLDEDKVGDACDPDDDGDGVPDVVDNCPKVANATQKDCDSDLIGAACEADDDNDGVVDTDDNCLCLSNSDQTDLNDNGVGDACDGDDDNDGVPDGVDLCPTVPDPLQADADLDEQGDACDADDDNDGVLDDGDGTGLEGDHLCVGGEVVACDDNCRLVPNPAQPDLDLDGQGNACDADADGDGVAAAAGDCNDDDATVHPGVVEGQPSDEACVYCNLVDDDCDGFTDEGCVDTDLDGILDCLTGDDDGDGVVDGVDNCPKVANSEQHDLDVDGLGDACDADADGDGVAVPDDCDDTRALTYPGAFEACNGVDDDCDLAVDDGFPNSDSDDQADCVDDDDDDDGVPDDGDGGGVVGDAPCADGQTAACDDNCRVVPNPDQGDLDGDTLGDACDDDDDDDGVLDDDDDCPRVVNGDQTDTDSDGQGDLCDDDDDDDGVPDDGDGSGVLGDAPCADGQVAGCDDNCRTVANPDQGDLDGDTLGDACDDDDDDDGVPDDGSGSGVAGDYPCGTDETVGCDDNCPRVINEDQANLDRDAAGDLCDPDQDGDGHDGPIAGGDDCNDRDATVNPSIVETQTAEGECGTCNLVDDDCDGQIDEGCFDANNDGTPDCLSGDDDGDGVVDGQDNCPKIANAGQENQDGDGLGDVCDPDKDGDGYPVATDCDDTRALTYPGAFEACNGVDDDCDGSTDEGFANADGDASADCVDSDDDNDGVPDDGDLSGVAGDHGCVGDDLVPCDDNCALVPNPGQIDLDLDGQGDACDTDDDGDNIPDLTDNCPRAANPAQIDRDLDGQGDVCDADDDNDGILDDGDGDGVNGNTPCTGGAVAACDDNCAVVPNPSQADLDGDGKGDACDGDLDGDGDPNETDCDDYNPAVKRGAAEVCDGVDNDCDSKTDAADAAELLANDLQACEIQLGVCVGATKRAALCQNGNWATCDTVAYTTNNGAYQALAEFSCDALDNDCNGVTDEDFSVLTADGKTLTGIGKACGTGACAGGSTVCLDDDSGIRCSSEVAIAGEVCNAADDDCDGKTDAADDLDLLAADGRDCENQAGVCAGSRKPASRCVGGSWQPCTDTIYAGWSTLYQVGREAACDDRDNDCDGASDEDFSVTGGDGTVYTGVGASCGVGLCAGGVTACRSDRMGVLCTTAGNAVSEVCDTFDNDCDGKTDSADGVDLVTHDGRLCENQVGVCAATQKPAALCASGEWQACTDVTYGALRPDYQAGAEVSCDAKDNDCDGAKDEDFSMVALDGRSFSGVGVACGVGRCANGLTQCDGGAVGIVCSTEFKSLPETCNTQDDDCDGAIDAADADLLTNDLRQCLNQSGVCAGSTKPATLCVGGAWQGCTNDTYLAHDGAYQVGAEATCDGKDNDCDGVSDEDFQITLLDGSVVVGVNRSCGQGVCAGGLTTCNALANGVVCSTEHKARLEVCNASDDDCDGKTDSSDGADLIANDGRACENQTGVCSGAKKPAGLCQSGSWVPCDATVYSTHSGGLYDGVEAHCDLRDNDCDGQVDEKAYDLCGGGSTRCIYGACLSDDVLVPAGSFWMGCNPTVDDTCADTTLTAEEKAYHEATTAAYWIDRTEVTAEMYESCASAGGCTAVSDSTCSEGGASTYGRLRQHPITCVTWTQAAAFCAWKGRRLCTEAEWEKAARGGCEFYGNCQYDSRRYPWGNDGLDCAHASLAEGGTGCGSGFTSPVGSRPAGASPYSLLDLAGNAWEWVTDRRTPDYDTPLPPAEFDAALGYDRTRRGGGYTSCLDLRVSARDAYPEGSGRADLGFRCCRNP
jgi:formylglycine-generating enzyme required for sulfatase activity